MSGKGFYHPSRGYWQTVTEPPQHIRDAYPAGTVEVPLKPGAHWDWDGAQWVEGTPPPAPVPAVVSSFQAKEALRDAGLFAAAETAATNAGGRTLRAWQSAPEFPRRSDSIAALAASMGLTDAQVDDLFRAAAQITA